MKFTRPKITPIEKVFKKHPIIGWLIFLSPLINSLLQYWVGNNYPQIIYQSVVSDYRFVIELKVNKRDYNIKSTLFEYHLKNEGTRELRILNQKFQGSWLLNDGVISKHILTDLVLPPNEEVTYSDHFDAVYWTPALNDSIAKLATIGKPLTEMDIVYTIEYSLDQDTLKNSITLGKAYAYKETDSILYIPEFISKITLYD